MKVLKLSLMISPSVLFLYSCTISNNNLNLAPVILSETTTVAYLVFIVSGYPLLFKRG